MMRRVQDLLILAFALAVLGGGAYLSGRSSGRTSLRIERNSEQLDTNAVAIDSAMRIRETAEKRRGAELEARAPIAAARRKARAAVDIDVHPPEVVALIGLDDRLILHDSLSIAALTTENLALRIERDRWRQRAELLEQRVKLVEAPRCSTKCGIAIGAGAVIALAVAIASVLP